MDKLATGNWQVSGGKWEWQVASVASATLNCKIPRIYQQCQQQIDFKANGQTDRQTEKVPLATLPPYHLLILYITECHPTQCATRPALFAYFHRLFGISFFI